MNVYKKIVCCLFILGSQQQLICQNSWWDSATYPFKALYAWSTRNTRNTIITTGALACIAAGCYAYQKYQAQYRLQNANAIKTFTQDKLWERYQELLNIDYGLKHNGAESKSNPNVKNLFFNITRNRALQVLQERINALQSEVILTLAQDYNNPQLFKEQAENDFELIQQAYTSWLAAKRLENACKARQQK